MENSKENAQISNTVTTGVSPESPVSQSLSTEEAVQPEMADQREDESKDASPEKAVEVPAPKESVMETFNREDASFSTDRYTLVKPIINAPTADFKQFSQLVKLWKGNKQYYVFIMVKTGISAEMVRTLVMKVRDKESAKSDSDMSFIAALSVLTGNDFLHTAYPTFEECYTAQTLRDMVRDYYNGPTREDRNNYETALARAEVSQKNVDDLRKQLEKYQEIFISHNDTSIKREESIRADYREMMEKDRAAFEKEMSAALSQKDEKIKELEKGIEDLTKKVTEAEENKTDTASMVAILKERDEAANEVQKLKKEASDRDSEIAELKNKLKAYQDAEKENAIRSKVKAELKKEFEEESARTAAQKQREIEKKEEELLQAKAEISQLKKDAAEKTQRNESAQAAGLTENQLYRIAKMVSDQLSERNPQQEEDIKEGVPEDIPKDIEDEILKEVQEAQDIYESIPIYSSDEIPDKEEAEAPEEEKKEQESEPEDILPKHMPSTFKKQSYGESKRVKKPPLFFRRHWEERMEMEEIEELGFQVIASDEYSEVQKNLIQEAIDNNLSLKNLRRLADPSIPEKNMSQALHYFLRKEKKVS